MCGILLACNTENKIPTGADKKKKKKEPIDPVNDWIINQYEDQAHRGKEGFGIIMIDKENNIELKRATTEVKFLLDLYAKKSNIIIAHHRAPTSSENKMSQTHPILVENEKLEHSYLIIHNGIVSNDNDLKEKHEKEGFTYTTEYAKTNVYNTNYNTTKFNDTEALAIEIALFIENKTSAIGTSNNAAFIAIQINKKENKATKIFFGRKGGMLNMAKTRGKLRLSSEGEGTVVKDMTLYSFELKDKSMDLRSKPLVFEEYKKPIKVYVPTREEFANKTLNLPGGKIVTRKSPDGVQHASACECPFCEKEKTRENKELQAILDIEEGIIYEQGGKIHHKDCKCTTCKADSGEIPQNNIVQTEAIEIYDEKFIEEEIKIFEDEIKSLDSASINKKLEETLENILDKIAEIAHEYKENLVNQIEMENEMNFATQIQMYLDTMKGITEIAEKEFDIVEAIEDNNLSYSKEITNLDPYDDETGWHGRHHEGRRVGFST